MLRSEENGPPAWTARRMCRSVGAMVLEHREASVHTVDCSGDYWLLVVSFENCQRQTASMPQPPSRPDVPTAD